MKFADVIVDISLEKLDKTFAYRIPEAMENRVQPGVLVQIPFGPGNRLIRGYVIGVSQEAKFPLEKLKDVEEVIDQGLPVESRLIALAAWIRDTYGGTMNQAIKTVLPVKTKVAAPAHYRIGLAVDRQEAIRILEELSLKKNLQARKRLLAELIQVQEMSKETAVGKLHLSDSTIQSMKQAGLITVTQVKKARTPFEMDRQQGKPVSLNEAQQQTVNQILEDLDFQKLQDPAFMDGRVQLIFGVTGSGKTEVYMEIIDQAVKQGRQAIMLIPEIALTYQTVRRFYNRFGDQIAMIHSRMSAGERYDQFMRAKNGEVSIVIGPRSALFAPFPNLGLIIIDEEHEAAYKSETIPRYHARETAIHLAQMTGSMVVLGSATPSVGSYHKALEGSFRLHEIAIRARENPLPQVHVVDLRQELKEGNKSIFSRKLRALIEDRLTRKEQTMLFINRRGFAGFVSCRSCGETIKCPHCDVALKYHKGDRLVCHYCGYEIPLMKACPSCGSPFLLPFGTGTQKVEELVGKQFPKARVVRMDLDTTRNKNGHQKILETFADQEADILVGTQMIVKGHDFPNVTLVGIIAADLSLYAPDYMASERTFDLLTQAAGRAGRGEKEGEVVIQTYNPDHYSISSAASQNYEQFYRNEIAFRELMRYPPVWELMALLLSSPREKEAEEAAQKVAKGLREIYGFPSIQGERSHFGEQTPGGRQDQKSSGKDLHVMIIGPSDAGVAKIKDIYRKILYIKADSPESLAVCRRQIENLIENSQIDKNISVQYDITPIAGF